MAALLRSLLNSPAPSRSPFRLRRFTMAAAAPAPYRSYIQPEADAEFPAEAGRYHLYVAYACPFASRALSARNLKGLQDVISISVAAPIFQKTKPNDPEDSHMGWALVDPAKTPFIKGPDGKEYSTAGSIPDTINNASFMRDLYELVDKTPRAFSVPVLWDKKKQTIVSNESADVLRTLNSGFRELVPSNVDLVPAALEAELNAVNDGIVNDITGGFFGGVFARDADGKKAAAERLSVALEKLNDILAAKRYLVGDAITEADVRMFHTLIRIDANLSKETQESQTKHANVVEYARDLYQVPALKATVNWDHLKISAVSRNPSAEGPFIDYEAPHSRASV
jgi:putative glutathione S-transferase